MEDKMELKLIELDRRIRQAQAELKDENLTFGQIGSLHVELKELKFAVKILNEIKDDQ